MLPVDAPACGCCCSRALVGQNEYQSTRGSKGAFEPCGALGKGGLEGLTLWEVCPDAVWPGVSGLVGGWARLARSKHDESDLLMGSEIWRSLNGAGIDCVNFDSFAGKQVSSNFTS